MIYIIYCPLLSIHITSLYFFSSSFSFHYTTIIFTLFSNIPQTSLDHHLYIHSIPDSLESFGDAMEGRKGYTATYAWGGLLAMVGSLLTFICEEFVHRRISRFAGLHGHAHDHEDHGHGHSHKHEHKHGKKEEEKKEEENAKDGYTLGKPDDTPSSSSGDSSPDSTRALEEGTISDSSAGTPPASPHVCTRPELTPHAELTSHANNTKDLDVVVEIAEEEVDVHKRELTETQIGYYTELYVLLFGLSFHSIFVGIALGVSGNDWGLFAAIIFHQFFEGLALGARVARAGFKSKVHIWLLDIVYPISYFFISFPSFSFSYFLLTSESYAIAIPVGIAIGVGIQSALEGDAFTYNIVNGVFQGLSGGRTLSSPLLPCSPLLSPSTLTPPLPHYLLSPSLNPFSPVCRSFNLCRVDPHDERRDGET